MNFEDPLAWLLEPESKEEFLAKILNEKYVVCRSADRERFKNLLSLSDLDAILGTHAIEFPDIRLVRSDEDVPHTDYVWKDNLVDPMRVGRLFASGATVIFGGLQDRHRAVQRLCTAMAEQTSMRTQANIYLTPPHSQGFDPHWDTHDVFVIQVEGNKHWRMYEGGIEHPHITQKFDPDQHRAGKVIDEFTLEAGQVLYIPRGIMHAAAATDDVSLHITLGVIAYTWADFLTDCVAEMTQRSAKWRESVPFGFGRADGAGPREIAAELRARLADLPDVVDADAVVGARLEQVENLHRPRETDHLRQALKAKALTGNERVTKRPGLPSRVERRGDQVVLRSGGREITFPDAALRTLTAVLASDSVALGELDDDLDPSSRTTVVSTLIREGILATHPAMNGGEHV